MQVRSACRRVVILWLSPIGLAVLYLLPPGIDSAFKGLSMVKHHEDSSNLATRPETLPSQSVFGAAKREILPSNKFSLVMVSASSYTIAHMLPPRRLKGKIRCTAMQQRFVSFLTTLVCCLPSPQKEYSTIMGCPEGGDIRIMAAGANSCE